jgi:hypothetical protein
MSRAVKACMIEVASKACSSACSALLLWTVDLSTLPNKLSSPFWFVGSVAEGGVNGAGGTCHEHNIIGEERERTAGKKYLLQLGKQITATPKLMTPSKAYPNTQQVK